MGLESDAPDDGRASHKHVSVTPGVVPCRRRLASPQRNRAQHISKNKEFQNTTCLELDSSMLHLRARMIKEEAICCIVVYVKDVVL